MKRRSFLQYALAGGVANLTIMKDLYAQAGGPIVIGHHCELTGGFASWGYWHDKAAKKAVELINKQGGIAKRKVELVTEDTESNPASGARKLRNLIERSNAEFVVGSVHSGIMLASIPIASELKTIYFSTGEATEATGSRGTRYSFRTGMDTYSLAAAGVPWAMDNVGKNWTVIFADYAWGQSHFQEAKAVVERLGGKVSAGIPVPLDTKDLVPYLARIPQDTQVLFSIFFGSLSIAFYTQAKAMGIDKRTAMYSI
jgi:branched-chain amino acid transport system substrate-binding protein